MLHSFVRRFGLAATRVSPPETWVCRSSLNAVVNELGFSLAADRIDRRPVRTTKSDRVEELLQASISRIEDLAGSRPAIADSEALELRDDAEKISSRILSFLERRGDLADVTSRPVFPGCGAVRASEGDLLQRSDLIEVKGGERQFSAGDLRQLLTYAALARKAGAVKVSTLSLLNPRLGVSWSSNVDALAVSISGKSGIDLLDDIASAMQDVMVSR